METKTKEITDRRVIYEGKWLNMAEKHATVTDGDKQSKLVWQFACRPWESDSRVVNGVIVLAIGKSKGKEDKIITIKNYRFPVEKYCIELPAGLVDLAETAKAAEEYEKNGKSETFYKLYEEAIVASSARELKEETGYQGKFVKLMTAPKTKNSAKIFDNLYETPWVTNCKSGIVLMEVDLDLPENQNPKAECEIDEFITVHLVDKSSLFDWICSEIEEKDIAVCSQLYFLAIGLNI